MSNPAVITLPTLRGPSPHDPKALWRTEKIAQQDTSPVDYPEPGHSCMGMFSSHCKAALKGQISPRAARSAQARSPLGS